MAFEHMPKNKTILAGLCCYFVGYGLYIHRNLFLGERQSTLPTSDSAHATAVGQFVRANNQPVLTEEQDTSIIKDSNPDEHEHSRADVLDDVISETTLCSQESRVARYKSVCLKHKIHDPEQTVSELFLDTDNKLSCCINKKAGSRSWLSFLIRNKVPGYQGGQNHNSTFVEPYGFDRASVISAANISEQFSDWQKHIVVRHPLQRLVSAYFQIQVGQRLEMEEVRLIPHMTFEEFVRKLVFGSLANKNAHWMEYNLRCRVCDVDYQFIAKEETLEQDVERFKDLYNFRQENVIKPGYQNKKIRFNVTDLSYKYDEMLARFQDEHPELMQGLLRLYALDMELFGYGWDWDKRTSFCADGSASGCC